MSARASEAHESPVTFTFDGHTYEVPPQPMWPIDVAEALEDQRFYSAARLVLGDEQWQSFKQRHRLGDAEAFFNAFGEAIGGNPT